MHTVDFLHHNHDFERLPRTTAHDGTRVYKTPSGRAYPSVTSITGLSTKKAITEWRARVGEKTANEISTRAATRGTKIHSLCEDYLNNKPVEPDIFDQEMWNSFLPELSKINNIHALEAPLYSDHLEVAGTVDCVAEYEGKMSIIDFKTSRKPKKESYINNYFMQASAYAVAFEERTRIPINRLVILIAVDEHDPQVFIQRRDDWIDQFIDLRKQYKDQKGI